MKERNNEAVVLQSDGITPYLEEWIDGKCIIAVQPNTEFKIKITVNSENNARLVDLNFYTDGVFACHLRKYVPEWSSKEGFLDCSFKDGYGYALKFGEINQNPVCKDNIGSNNAIGLIKVVFTESEVTREPYVVKDPSIHAISAENCPVASAPAGDRKINVRELVNRPSLQIYRGRRLPHEPCTTKNEPYCWKWRSIRPLQETTLTFYYHDEKFVPILRMISKNMKLFLLSSSIKSSSQSHGGHGSDDEDQEDDDEDNDEEDEDDNDEEDEIDQDKEVIIMKPPKKKFPFLDLTKKKRKWSTIAK